ncbi:unnamed protein product [Heligmosomoides polygyrus]|uniref:Uncharacterized protein n=1 Tax=Heligmosomoides polygyrus TaxID=6339 RepID=A0A183GJI7_HELPZ|nr:unnamed protein product [Heligmosomoides polygyrus]
MPKRNAPKELKPISDEEGDLLDLQEDQVEELEEDPADDPEEGQKDDLQQSQKKEEERDRVEERNRNIGIEIEPKYKDNVGRLDELKIMTELANLICGIDAKLLDAFRRLMQISTRSQTNTKFISNSSRRRSRIDSIELNAKSTHTENYGL